MPAIAVTLLKVLFLALLWIFVISCAGVIRTDLFGRAVPSSDLPQELEKPRKKRRKRGTPTRVEVVEGPQTGAWAELPDGSDPPLKIGRTGDCAIRLDDDYVSTLHAQIRADNAGGWFIEDRGSTNGTYVNGQMVTQPTTITMADTVRVGRTIMKLVSV